MPQARTARRHNSVKTSGKARITISLSKDKVRFLKAHSGRTGASSVSAFIEQLVADAEARAQLESLGASTARYYDSLSSSEIEDRQAWGELGELGLAAARE